MKRNDLAIALFITFWGFILIWFCLMEISRLSRFPYGALLSFTSHEYYVFILIIFLGKIWFWWRIAPIFISKFFEEMYSRQISSESKAAIYINYFRLRKTLSGMFFLSLFGLLIVILIRVNSSNEFFMVDTKNFLILLTLSITYIQVSLFRACIFFPNFKHMTDIKLRDKEMIEIESKNNKYITTPYLPVNLYYYFSKYVKYLKEC